MKKVLGNILLILFVSIILVFSVRGLPGNPTPAQLNTLAWKDNGPFELSPERGRFALLYSIVQNHSFQFTTDLARFTSPDVGYIGTHYVSIFAPSISFLAIPGYIIGKYFNLSQYGTFLWMSLFALFNVLLIRTIAIKLGAHPIAATIAGLTFLFATPAFPYAVTIYEHNPSTFIMLLAFYLYMRFNSVWSLLAIWVLYAFGFTVDYPNLFMMLPIAVAAFFKSFKFEYIRKKVTFNISLPKILTVVGVILPLMFLLWVNKVSYGNPFMLSGTVESVESIAKNGSPIFLTTLEQQQLSKSNTPVNIPPPSALSYFNPRNMLNGLYELLISPDRGILMFTPVMIFGAVGLYFAIKKKQPYTNVLMGIIAFDLLLYSMWGDPYGGWAFGARYLIPAYAILSIYIALLLSWFGRKRFFLLFFFLVFSYSMMVNTLGAITSNSNPPEIQAIALSQQIRQPVSYTYMRNVNDLNKNISKSFIFQAYANNYMTAWNYYTYIALFILTVCSFYIMSFYMAMKKGVKKGRAYAV